MLRRKFRVQQRAATRARAGHAALFRRRAGPAASAAVEMTARSTQLVGKLQQIHAAVRGRVAGVPAVAVLQGRPAAGRRPLRAGRRSVQLLCVISDPTSGPDRIYQGSLKGLV
jgi:hypothetical protein